MTTFKCDSCGFETESDNKSDAINCQRVSPGGSFCMKTARKVVRENDNGRMTDLPGHSADRPRHVEK